MIHRVDGRSARLRMGALGLALAVLFSLVPAAAGAVGAAILGQVQGPAGGVLATITLAPCPAGVICTTTSRASDGYFEFLNVPDGSYTVAVAPTDPGLAAPAPTPVTVVGGVSPRSLFITVIAANTVTMDGLVTDNHGGGVPSQEVVLHDISGLTPDVGGPSDATGHYHLQPLRNTNYWIEVSTTANVVEVHAPAIYNVRTGPANPLVVGTTAITGFNLDLPEVRVRICVVDPAGRPVFNALLSTDQSQTLALTLAGRPASGSDWYHNVGYPTTDTTGCGTLWLFPNAQQHILTVTPHGVDAATMAVTSFSMAVTLASDGMVLGPFRLAAPATFNGTLVDSSGAPLGGQRVEVQQAGLGAGAPWMASSGPTPAFSIPGLVLGASYNVRVSRDSSLVAPYNGPDQYSLQTTSPIVMGSAPVTLTFPAVASTVRVTANGGAMPLAGVVLTAPALMPGNGLLLAGQPATGSNSMSSAWVATGADGSGRLWLFPAASAYTVTATPGAGRVCTTGTVLLSVPGPVAVDLTCSVRVLGTVLDAAGLPLPGQTVKLTSTGGVSVSATSGRGGRYSLVVASAGTYTLLLSGANGAAAGASPAVPPVYQVSTQLALTADRTALVLQAPFSSVDLSVTSGVGAVPVAGASVSAPSMTGVGGLSFAGGVGTASFDYSSAPPVTGADGKVRLWLLPGSYVLRATAGALSGTASVVIPGVSTATINLSADDGLPPVITPVFSIAPNAYGWFRTPVTVSWTITDDTAVSASCPPVTVNPDTPATGVTLTCTATDSAGHVSVASVTVRSDATAPVLTWTPQGATFSVDQTVSLSCTAVDALSGPASQSCGSVSAPAYSFALGANTVLGTASDLAGNAATLAGHFTVTVSAASLCSLVNRFERTVRLARAMCLTLGIGPPPGDEEEAPRVRLDAFAALVRSQRGRTLTAAQADVLLRLGVALAPPPVVPPPCEQQVGEFSGQLQCGDQSSANNSHRHLEGD